jgi:glycosyltransferase 2 family protein
MTDSSILHRSFQSWKIWLAISLGLIVACWMLYRSISEVQFIEVHDQSGEYNWHDSNGNGIVDKHLKSEFTAVPKGNYTQQTVTDALEHIHWTSNSFLWICIAILFMVGRDLFYIIRIRLLTHKELSWKRGFYVIMLWEFASALAPGVVGGVTVAMFILNREKIALGRSTAIVIVTAMMDNLFYVIMIPFVFLFVDAYQLFPQHSFSTIGVHWVFWIGFGIIVFASLFLFSSLFLFPTLAPRVLGFIFRLPGLKRWQEKAIRTGNDIVIASNEMRKEKPSFWLKSFAATCASWISRYLVINALLQAFLNLGFIDHILILGKQFVLWLFMHVSPTPGGSGVAEYAFGELLISFSQSTLLLAGLAVLWRLISYFPYLFIGAFLLPRWLKRTVDIKQ